MGKFKVGDRVEICRASADGSGELLIGHKYFVYRVLSPPKMSNSVTTHYILRLPKEVHTIYIEENCIKYDLQWYREKRLKKLLD